MSITKNLLLAVTAIVATVAVLGGIVLGSPALRAFAFTGPLPRVQLAADAQPLGIAMSPDGVTAYVANSGLNTVSVINTNTGLAAATPIALAAGAGASALAVSPSGLQLYVVGVLSVSVIDTTSNLLTNTISVAATSVGVAFAPDGRSVYVTSGDSIVAIDAAANSGQGALLGNPISLPTGSNPSALAVTPDGSKLYIANNGSNTVSVVDLTGGRNPGVVSTFFAVGASPRGIAITPDGKQVYVANSAAATISIIDVSPAVPANGQAGVLRAAPVSTPGQPWGVSFSPDGAKAYVANKTGNSVTVLTVATAAVDATSLAVGQAPKWIAFTPDGRKMFVTNSADNANSISVIDMTTRRASTIDKVLSYPQVVAFTPDGKTAYVSNYSGGYRGTVSVFDVKSEQWITDISMVGAMVGPDRIGGPAGIAVSPDGKQVYVAEYNSGTIGVINTADNTVQSSINMQGQFGRTSGFPDSVVFALDGKTAYVTMSSYDSVAVIDTTTHAVQYAYIGSNAGPRGLAITPDGSKLYVADRGSGAVTVYNLAAGQPTANNAIATFTMSGLIPQDIAISPNGTVAYVTSQKAAGNVAVISIGAANQGAGTMLATTIPVGSNPGAVKFNSDGTIAYVANNGDDTISIIDVVTGQPRSETIPSPSPSVRAIALTPDGTKLFTTGYLLNGTVAVIEFGSRLMASPAVATRPQGISVTPDGLTAYVANSGSNSVSIFKVLTTQSALALVLPDTTAPTALAVSPDGSQIYVAGGGARQVSIITAADNSVTSIALAPGVTATSVAFSATTPARAFVTTKNGDGSPGGVSIIALTADHTVTTIAVGANPSAIAITASGRAYVTNKGTAAAAGTVSVISVATGQVLTTLTVGKLPTGVATTGAIVYVTNSGDNTVSIISDATTPAVTKSVVVGSNPNGVAISPDGSLAYVANSGTVAPTIGDSVSVISVARGAVQAVITVGASPSGVAFTPNGRIALVTNFTDNTVSVLDATIAPSFTASSPPLTAQAGVPYSYAFGAAGSPNPAIREHQSQPGPSFALTRGALPLGLTLDRASGLLSGTPIVTGIFTYMVSAINGTVANAYGRSQELTVIAGQRLASIASLQLSALSASTMAPTGTAATATGTLNLTMADYTGTNAGWNVSVQASDFAYTAPIPSSVGETPAVGAAIPATGFLLLSAGALKRVVGQAIQTGGTDAAPTGPQQARISGTPAYSGPLSSARPVLRAAQNRGAGVYTQALPVKLTVPATSAVGLYTSTMTVTIAVGP